MRVLITGASSGFGHELALAAQEAGHTPIATMRRAAGRGDDLRSRGIEVFDLDVTSDASAEACVAAAGRVDVLVNNAGFGVFGPAETITPDDLRAQFETNLFGAHRMNRAVLPQMRERGDGLLVQVTSGAGMLGMPSQGAYGASKHALEALAESLRWELAPLGVDCVLVEPGPFATKFDSSTIQASDGARADAYEHVAAAGKWRWEHTDPGDAREIADAIVRLIDTPRGDRPMRTIVHHYLQQQLEALAAARGEALKAMLDLYGPTDLRANGVA